MVEDTISKPAANIAKSFTTICDFVNLSNTTFLNSVQSVFLIYKCLMKINILPFLGESAFETQSHLACIKHWTKSFLASVFSSLYVIVSLNTE